MADAQQTFKQKAFLDAIRLRTLPLAAGAVIMGASLALQKMVFSGPVFMLTLLTAFLLQILSNLANDYGDFIHGADGANRTDRALASGKISAAEMKRYLATTAILSLASGIALLVIARQHSGIHFGGMFVLGLVCMAAAFFYTAGSKPYGYYGLGDLSVIIFFGFVAVSGSLYLHSGKIEPDSILAATSFGLLSAAVLNVNNIRDIETDRLANKKTLALKIGFNAAKVYQAFLLAGGVLCIMPASLGLSFSLLWMILPVILLFIHFIKFCRISPQNRLAFNKQLKFLSLTNLLFAVCYLLMHF